MTTACKALHQVCWRAKEKQEMILSPGSPASVREDNFE